MGVIPTLPDDFTRPDLAQLINSVVSFAWLTCVLVVLLLSVIAFRGRR